MLSRNPSNSFSTVFHSGMQKMSKFTEKTGRMMPQCVTPHLQKTNAMYPCHKTIRRTLLAALLVIAVSCNHASPPSGTGTPSVRSAETADDLKSLNRLWATYSSQGRNQELIELARPVYRRALERGETKKAAYAGAYIGQAFGMLFQPDSMYYYFDEITELAGAGGYEFPLMVINNTIGVHNLMYAMNYAEALHYFYEALAHCRKVDERASYQILFNIANACYLRNDPSGLEPALEIYAYGKASGDDAITYIGALMTAYMYYVAGDNEQALDYVEQTTRLDAYCGGINNSDALHGNILARLGRNDEAERYYRRAIAHSLPDYATLIESYQSYGDFLRRKGSYRSAIRNYLEGLAIVEQHDMYFHGYKLYLTLADAYSAIGRNDKAYGYMRTYHDLADSVFNVEKERSFNSLRLRYENQKRENAIQERDLRLLRGRKRMQLLISVSAFLLVSGCAFFLLYRRKTIMYRQLVKNYDLHFRREKLLADRIHDGETADDDRNDGRLRELFNRLNVLMTEQELYRSNDLTIEAAARRLDTNRSYLSKAVNRYSGTSFAGYVNAFRIAKAVELLSDPENRIPIKALADELGYNNLPSFYQNFQKETGVPPSRYRQETQRIREDRLRGGNI